MGEKLVRATEHPNERRDRELLPKKELEAWIKKESKNYDKLLGVGAGIEVKYPENKIYESPKEENFVDYVDMPNGKKKKRAARATRGPMGSKVLTFVKGRQIGGGLGGAPKARRKARARNRPGRTRAQGRRKAPKGRRGRGQRRVAGLSGAPFTMDYASFKGKDYVDTLVFTGPGTEGPQILEKPGQVIWKEQVQPWKMVPNGRLARCISLFEKWRVKSLWFEFRSAMPPGNNAGSILVVYEPNALEKMPDVTLGTSAIDRVTLSRYEAHSNVSILPVQPPTDERGGRSSSKFVVRTDLQKGPFGGWFYFDRAGDQPLQNCSFGQIMIMVQNPMNCRGSSGSYSAGEEIDWADLIMHYEIECSVANDEPQPDAANDIRVVQGEIALGVGEPYQGFNTLDNTNNNFLEVATSAFSGWPIVPGDVATDGFEGEESIPNTLVNNTENKVTIFVPCDSDQTSLLWILAITAGTAADFGTTSSSFPDAACLTQDDEGANDGVVFVVGGDVHNTTSWVVGWCPAPRDDHTDDFFQLDFGSWSVGTTGSADVTGSDGTADFMALEFPAQLPVPSKKTDLTVLLRDPAVMKMLLDAAGPKFLHRTRPSRLILDDAKLEKKMARKFAFEEEKKLGLREEKKGEVVILGERVKISQTDDWDEIPTPVSQKGLVGAVRNFNRTRALDIVHVPKSASKPVSLKG